MKKLLGIEDDASNSELVKNRDDILILISENGACDRALVRDKLIAISEGQSAMLSQWLLGVAAATPAFQHL